MSNDKPTFEQTPESREILNRMDEAARRSMLPAQPGQGTLGTTPDDWICIECPKCGRWGEYKRETIIAEFGADMGLPDLLHPFARSRGCTKARTTSDPYDPRYHSDCGVRYRIEEPNPRAGRGRLR